jgi:membrane-bound lytic murein transglycosylase MltF
MVVVATLAVSCGGAASPPAAADASEDQQATAVDPGRPFADAGPAAEFIGRPWTGDLDGMIERRMIRVLVPYSKTHFFIDGGTTRGLAYEVGRKFEDELNTRLATRHLRVRVVFVPLARDQLIPALLEGRGDVVAAALTVTPERLTQVAFGPPQQRNVSEIIVTGPEGPAISTVDDLSGKEVFVRRSSSYYESLQALNERLVAAGKEPARLTLAPEVFEDEDLLEMTSAGLVDIVVVDDYLARFWAQIFPSLTLHEDITLRTGGVVAAAFRPNSPELQAALEGFYRRNGPGTLFGNILLHRYFSNTNFARRATARTEMIRLENVAELFKTYSSKYNLDWLLMAAQSYQESRLDHSVRSPVGAIGIMQIMPATGRAMNVGDIHKLDVNIHAGVKYLRYVIDRHFANDKMDDLNRGLFAFASYNAGPARIRRFRTTAAERGLDPNLWFNNVERIGAEVIGRETVQYVSNIFKYYVAYQLAMAKVEARREARPSPQ